jgi:hypothetical protein
MDAPLESIAANGVSGGGATFAGDGPAASTRAGDQRARSASARVARVGDPDQYDVLFPNLYAWYVLASTLDIIVTNTIIHQFGGWEVNHIADTLIEAYGTWGLIFLKYCSVLLVVVICETIGRRSMRAGRNLALAAVIISAMPVGIGLIQIYAWIRGVL